MPRSVTEPAGDEDVDAESPSTSGLQRCLEDRVASFLSPPTEMFPGPEEPEASDGFAVSGSAETCKLRGISALPAAPLRFTSSNFGGCGRMPPCSHVTVGTGGGLEEDAELLEEDGVDGAERSPTARSAGLLCTFGESRCGCRSLREAVVSIVASSRSCPGRLKRRGDAGASVCISPPRTPGECPWASGEAFDFPNHGHCFSIRRHAERRLGTWHAGAFSAGASP